MQSFGDAHEMLSTGSEPIGRPVVFQALAPAVGSDELNSTAAGWRALPYPGF
jgi:hypothetical protein